MRIVNLAIMTIIVIAAIISSGCLAVIHANEERTNVNVQKKMIDVSRKGSHYLLITDKGVFEVDRPITDRLNQSRNPDIIYSSIIEGKNYTLHHYGYRIDWLYEYPLVVDSTRIN